MSLSVRDIHNTAMQKLKFLACMFKGGLLSIKDIHYRRRQVGLNDDQRSKLFLQIRLCFLRLNQTFPLKWNLPFDSNIVPVGHAMYEFECAVYICSFEKRQKSCHGSSALFHLFLAELSRSSSLKSTASRAPPSLSHILLLLHDIYVML